MTRLVGRSKNTDSEDQLKFIEYGKLGRYVLQNRLKMFKRYINSSSSTWVRNMDGYQENPKGPANIYSKESQENLRSYGVMLPHIKKCEGAYNRNERH